MSRYSSPVSRSTTPNGNGNPTYKLDGREDDDSVLTPGAFYTTTSVLKAKRRPETVPLPQPETPTRFRRSRSSKSLKKIPPRTAPPSLPAKSLPTEKDYRNGRLSVRITELRDLLVDHPDEGTSMQCSLLMAEGLSPVRSANEAVLSDRSFAQQEFQTPLFAWSSSDTAVDYQYDFSVTDPTSSLIVAVFNCETNPPQHCGRVILPLHGFLVARNLQKDVHWWFDLQPVEPGVQRWRGSVRLEILYSYLQHVTEERLPSLGELMVTVVKANNLAIQEDDDIVGDALVRMHLLDPTQPRDDDDLRAVITTAAVPSISGEWAWNDEFSFRVTAHSSAVLVEVSDTHTNASGVAVLPVAQFYPNRFEWDVRPPEQKQWHILSPSSSRRGLLGRVLVQVSFRPRPFPPHNKEFLAEMSGALDVSNTVFQGDLKTALLNIKERAPHGSQVYKALSFVASSQRFLDKLKDEFMDTVLASRSDEEFQRLRADLEGAVLRTKSLQAELGAARAISRSDPEGPRPASARSAEHLPAYSLLAQPQPRGTGRTPRALPAIEAGTTSTYFTSPKGGVEPVAYRIGLPACVVADAIPLGGMRSVAGGDADTSKFAHRIVDVAPSTVNVLVTPTRDADDDRMPTVTADVRQLVTNEDDRRVPDGTTITVRELDGSFHVYLTSLHAGTFSLSIYCDMVLIPEGSILVRFEAGPAVPSFCYCCIESGFASGQKSDHVGELETKRIGKFFSDSFFAPGQRLVFELLLLNAFAEPLDRTWRPAGHTWAPQPSLATKTLPSVEVLVTNQFDYIYSLRDDVVLTAWRPIPPRDCCILGDTLALGNDPPTTPAAVVRKHASLKHPRGFVLVHCDETARARGHGFFVWRPIPPDHMHVAAGLCFTTTALPPPFETVVCPHVRDATVAALEPMPVLRGTCSLWRIEGGGSALAALPSTRREEGAYMVTPHRDPLSRLEVDHSAGEQTGAHTQSLHVEVLLTCPSGVVLEGAVLPRSSGHALGVQVNVPDEEGTYTLAVLVNNEHVASSPMSFEAYAFCPETSSVELLNSESGEAVPTTAAYYDPVDGIPLAELGTAPLLEAGATYDCVVTARDAFGALLLGTQVSLDRIGIELAPRGRVESVGKMHQSRVVAKISAAGNPPMEYDYPLLRVAYKPRASADPSQWQTVGLSAEGTPVVVCHTLWRERFGSVREVRKAVPTEATTLVLDVSKSMSRWMPDYDRSRLSVAKSSTLELLGSLPSSSTFEIIKYGDTVLPLFGSLCPATEENIAAARSFVSELNSIDETQTVAPNSNMFRALERVLAGKTYSEMSRLVLFSDGEPEIRAKGTRTPMYSKHADVDDLRKEILHAVADWTSNRKIMMMCHALYATREGLNFMSQLASVGSQWSCVVPRGDLVTDAPRDLGPNVGRARRSTTLRIIEERQEPGKPVLILLDVSLSMLHDDKLERAKEAASELFMSLSSTAFDVVAFAGHPLPCHDGLVPPSERARQRTQSFLDEVLSHNPPSGVGATERGTDFLSALELALGAPQYAAVGHVYIISDGGVEVPGELREDACSDVVSAAQKLIGQRHIVLTCMALGATTAGKAFLDSVAAAGILGSSALWRGPRGDVLHPPLDLPAVAAVEIQEVAETENEWLESVAVWDASSSGGTIIILDVSRSMTRRIQGRAPPISQAKAKAMQVVQSLNDGVLFEVIKFGAYAATAFGKLQTSGQDTRSSALFFISQFNTPDEVSPVPPNSNLLLALDRALAGTSYDSVGRVYIFTDGEVEQPATPGAEPFTTLELQNSVIRHVRRWLEPVKKRSTILTCIGLHPTDAGDAFLQHLSALGAKGSECLREGRCANDSPPTDDADNVDASARLPVLPAGAEGAGLEQTHAPLLDAESIEGDVAREEASTFPPVVVVLDVSRSMAWTTRGTKSRAAAACAIGALAEGTLYEVIKIGGQVTALYGRYESATDSNLTAAVEFALTPEEEDVAGGTCLIEGLDDALLSAYARGGAWEGRRLVLFTDGTPEGRRVGGLPPPLASLRAEILTRARERWHEEIKSTVLDVRAYQCTVEGAAFLADFAKMGAAGSRCAKYGSSDVEPADDVPEELVVAYGISRGQTHTRKASKMDVCAKCGDSISSEEMETHRQMVCAFRLENCALCGQPFPWKELATHEADCDEQLAPCFFCNTRFPIAAMEEHKSTCVYAFLTCDACGEDKIRRRDLEHHRASLCQYRFVECPHCLAEFPAHHRSAHKRDECAFRGVPCPFCNIDVPMPELEGHKEICDMRRVNCEKCGDNLAQGDMPQHLNLDCPERLVSCRVKGTRCLRPHPFKDSGAHNALHKRVARARKELASTKPLVGLVIERDGHSGLSIVTVAGVARASPAEDAGFRAGDVITKWGPVRVRGVKEFNLAFNKLCQPGAHVPCVITRGTHSLELALDVLAKGKSLDAVERLKAEIAVLLPFEEPPTPEEQEAMSR